MKLITLLLLAFRLVDATSDNATKLESDQKDKTNRSLQSGCCSWDDGRSCGSTTAFCKANQANCQNFCNGRWILDNDRPTPTPPTPTPPSGGSTQSGCCSWDGGRSCGSTTAFCKANRANCQNFCNGRWISDNNRPTPTPPTPTPPSGGSSCGCSSCTSSILNRNARGHKVGARINWLKKNRNMSEKQACTTVCSTEFPKICGACNPDSCGAGPTPSPPTPSPPGAGPGTRATTTRYWDCSGGHCGCGYIPRGSSEPAHCESNALFKAPGGNSYGATFYGTAAISASLGANERFLTGCGQCFKVTGTGNVGGMSGKSTTLVLKSANYCPAGNPLCEKGPHFDIAAPGFDHRGVSLSNNCEKLFGGGAAGKFFACEGWPASTCNCNVFRDRTLREGCQNFLSLGWNNVEVRYEKVSCPNELSRQNCWEKNRNKWPSWRNKPQFCANN